MGCARHRLTRTSIDRARVGLQRKPPRQRSPLLTRALLTPLDLRLSAESKDGLDTFATGARGSGRWGAVALRRYSERHQGECHHRGGELRAGACPAAQLNRERKPRARAVARSRNRHAGSTCVVDWWSQTQRHNSGVRGGDCHSQHRSCQPRALGRATSASWRCLRRSACPAHRYDSGPVRGGLGRRRAGRKPFSQWWEEPAWPAGGMRVFNTGGWVVDHAAPQPLQGGAVVLVSDDLDVVSLRIYQQVGNAIFAGDHGRDGEADARWRGVRGPRPESRQPRSRALVYLRGRRRRARERTARCHADDPGGRARTAARMTP